MVLCAEDLLHGITQSIWTIEPCIPGQDCTRMIVLIWVGSTSSKTGPMDNERAAQADTLKAAQQTMAMHVCQRETQAVARHADTEPPGPSAYSLTSMVRSGLAQPYPMDVPRLGQVTNVCALHDHLEHEDLL